MAPRDYALRLFRSSTHDIATNLALEEWLLRTLPLPDGHTQGLMLWRNSPTIVFGRNQNPWVECDVHEATSRGVRLARRVSGGGTVYHDLGNLCVTFFSPHPGLQSGGASADTFSKATNMAVIRSALATLGIPSTVSNRTDLLVNVNGAPKKVSGSAFRVSGGRAYHHCTLLLHSDLEALRRTLKPPPRLITGRGVTSIPHPVANLAELRPPISVSEVCDALATAFCNAHGRPRQPIGGFDIEAVSKDPIYAKFRAEMESPEWVYGEGPPFTATLRQGFTWGDVDLEVAVSKGTIEVLKCEAVGFPVPAAEALRAALHGVPYQPAPIREALQRLPGLPPEVTADLLAWLPSAL
jgi:lipoate-protein ligase A